MKDDDIDRSLIEAAREGLAPTDEDRARVRRAVRTAIAGGAAIGAAGAATTASAAAKGAIGAWTIAKAVAVSAGVLTLAVGTTWGVMEAAEEQEPVASAAESAAAREVVPAREHAAPIGRAIAPEPAPAAAAIELEPWPEQGAPRDLAVAPDRRVRTRREAARATEREPAREVEAGAATEPEGERAPPLEPAQEAAGSTTIEPAPSEAAPRVALAAPSAREALVSETELLRDAHRALQAHDPARALAILDQHAARFPAGALAEERSATRVLALCDAGRTAQARAEASRFVAAHPRSMHAARVRASSCTAH